VSERHRLLRRQLARHRLREGVDVPCEFANDVDLAYHQADADRAVLERSLELTSEELLTRNAELVVALAAERARREAADRHHHTLARLATILAEEPALDRALDRLCAEASAALEVERTSVWILDHGAESLTCQTLYARSAGAVVASPPPINARDVPRYLAAAADQRAVAIDDVRTDPLCAELVDYFAEHGIGSSLSAPCRIAGDVVGFVAFTHVGAPRRWTAEQQLFTASVADCVSLLVENQRRRHAEEARAHLEGNLRQSQRMESIGMLAGGVAHDFNNLLTPILANAELVLETMQADHPDRVLLEGVFQAGEAARDVVGQLLAFSRKQILQLQVLDVNAEIEKLGRLLGRTLPENVELVLAMEPGGLAVRADPGQFQQVVLNLIVNAKDALANGVGTIRVGTRARRATRGEQVEITVADSGAGMPPDVLAKVFEPFFTTKAIGRGTGLGLSTVYGIVRQHGGTITVSSEPGAGSRFTICMPRTNEHPGGRRRAATLTAGAGRTILVVEDEPMVRGVVCRLLAGQGYCVIETGSPVEAIAIARERPDIALVVADVMMPGMNGRQMCDEIRRRRPGTPIVYISGYDNDVLAPHGVLADDVALVRKPFSSNELLAKVQAALRPPTNPGTIAAVP